MEIDIWDEIEKDFRRRTAAVVKCFKSSETLALNGAKAVDPQPLQRLPYLHHLKLSYNGLHEWGVKRCVMMHVAALTGLVRVELRLYNLTHEVLRLLVSLVCLEKLNLQARRKITDASTSTMVLLPALTDVNGRDCNRIADVDTVHLATMTGLARLFLGLDYGIGQSLSTEGPTVLGTMTNLVALDVGYRCCMSDSGVGHLKSLTNLSYLNLPANTSGATLVSLKSLTAISHLRFHYCKEVKDRVVN